MNLIRFFRYVAIIEAISFLILLGFAMPISFHFGDNELFVKHIFGPAHGGLFLLFGFALLLAMWQANWSFKTAFKLGLSSLVPVLPFFIDSWLKKEERRVHQVSPE